MTSLLIGLVVGGILPAILFGFSGIFAKASNSAGIGLGYYLLSLGAAVISAGLLCHAIVPNHAVSFGAVRDAFLSGATWAFGAALVAIALVRYGSPISQLMPPYNTNALIGVILGLWIFAEWQTVDVPKLVLGTVLIVAGAALVAWS